MYIYLGVYVCMCVYVCACVCVCLLKPSTPAGCDIRSIFMRSLTCLNSENSFSLTGCHTKFKEPVIQFTYCWKKNNRIYTFSKVISVRRTEKTHTLTYTYMYIYTHIYVYI